MQPPGPEKNFFHRHLAGNRVLLLFVLLWSSWTFWELLQGWRLFSDVPRFDHLTLALLRDQPALLWRDELFVVNQPDRFIVSTVPWSGGGLSIFAWCCVTLAIARPIRLGPIVLTTVTILLLMGLLSSAQLLGSDAVVVFSGLVLGLQLFISVWWGHLHRPSDEEWSALVGNHAGSWAVLGGIWGAIAISTELMLMFGSGPSTLQINRSQGSVDVHIESVRGTHKQHFQSSSLARLQWHHEVLSGSDMNGPSIWWALYAQDHATSPLNTDPLPADTLFVFQQFGFDGWERFEWDPNPDPYDGSEITSMHALCEQMASLLGAHCTEPRQWPAVTMKTTLGCR